VVLLSDADARAGGGAAARRRGGVERAHRISDARPSMQDWDTPS
jgi:hypothetical protein